MSATRLTGVLRAPLERERELARVEDVLSAARDGRGGILRVSGPAGIGKSTVLMHARKRASSDGCTVRFARGAQLERGFTWSVVRQLFEECVNSVELVGNGLLRGAAGLALPVFGLAEPDRLQPPSDPTFSALHGLYWLSVNMSEQRPLLLCVDDVHWADAPSLRFLAYLGARVEELPIAIVLASRDGASITELDGLPSVEIAQLGPLSVAAVASLARDQLGSAPDHAFARACHAAVQGNPLLANMLLSRAREAGVSPTIASAQRLAQLGASAVAPAVRRWLAGLGPDAVSLAEAVAVLGSDAQSGHAATLAGLRPDPAAAAVDELAARGVLVPGRRLDFAHPVVRAAVYDAIPASRRARDHARAAELTAIAGASPERIAVHLLATDPAGDVRTVEVLMRAARRALDRGAAETAVCQLRRALEEPPPADLAAEILAELGTAETRLGDADGIGHLRRAAKATAGPRRARLARRLAFALVPPGRYEEAVDVLADASDALDERDRELALTLEADIATIGRLSPLTRARTRARLARIDVEVPGATAAQRALLATAALERTFAGAPCDEAATLAERALDEGLLDDQGADSHLVYDALYALIVADRLEAADRAFTAGFADARARGSVLGYARLSCFRALLRLRQGALADAEADARASIEVTGDGWVIGRMAQAFLAEILLERGEPLEAERALGAFGEQEIPDTLMLNFVLFARARVRLARAQLDSGIADLAMLEHRERGFRASNPACFPLRSEAAIALTRAGRREEAIARARDELVLARRWGSPRAVAVALRAVGVAEGDADKLAEAAGVLEAIGSPLMLAHVLVELGETQRRARRSADARIPLRRGLDLAHRCGASSLAQRAHDELLASGARPRRRALTGVQSLTPSELRVARLASQGLTNRAIAETLFVTRRTVEVHLTRTYLKLNIKTRAELKHELTSQPSPQA